MAEADDCPAVTPAVTRRLTGPLCVTAFLAPGALRAGDLADEANSRFKPERAQQRAHPGTAGPRYRGNEVQRAGW